MNGFTISGGTQQHRQVVARLDAAVGVVVAAHLQLVARDTRRRTACGRRRATGSRISQSTPLRKRSSARCASHLGEVLAARQKGVEHRRRSASRARASKGSTRAAERGVAKPPQSALRDSSAALRRGWRAWSAAPLLLALAHGTISSPSSLSPVMRSPRRRRHLRAAVGQPQRVEHKGAIDLVTETDRARRGVDRRRGCGARFPTISSSARRRRPASRPARPPADRYAWYLDPLDGTTNFAHGHPHFAVSLALARGAELLVGVVADPLRDETFVAVRGGGATCNGAPHPRLAARPSVEAALLATGTPYDRRERADLYLGLDPRLHAALRRASGAAARRRSTSAGSPAGASTPTGSGGSARGTSPPARSSCARPAAR